ncbi:Ger(x)C family spore germination protein [Paenibacillus pabuli]|uniref:Ger(x)C family spore germination protein n=1 Tax=Paenibacillus pabuli TaxID=1472 RepID=UPI000780EED5|nr:Ger(x)C family spore germination protein [Paenibacillus pabuli]MEC0128232.1 Ger(x)C family spore germination protein [Paenibacillus pabuli]
MTVFKRVLIAGLSLLLLSGCWNRIELNEIAITSATGYDRSGDDWVATYQFIVPSSITSNTGGGAGASQPAVHVFSTTGSTITEAANLSNLENPRTLYFAHNNTVIIGKKAMEHGIQQLMDRYFRGADSRETVWVLLTDQKAGDILRKAIPPEKVPGSSIAQILLKEKRISSIFPPITILDYASKMNSDAKAIGIPIINTAGIDNPENEKKLESLDIYKELSPPLKIRLTELGVIKNDRLIGRMNREESRGLSWITNKVNGTVLSIPSSELRQKKDISIEVISSKTKLKPIKVGYHYNMDVHVKVKANLSESGSRLDLSKNKIIKIVEHQAARQITKEINSSWEVMQQLGADLGGFADLIHKKNPNEWKELKAEWEKEFKKMELNVHVNVIIKRPGLFQNSFRNLE